MAALSLIAVPVYLDTSENSPQLLCQWARTYHYGHQVLPTMAVGTFVLYMYMASRSRQYNGKRSLMLLSGLTTVMMVPFTWVFMTSTNNELFRLESLTRIEAEAATLSEVRELVVRWSGLHAVRCIFPFAGALLGVFGML